MADNPQPRSDDIGPLALPAITVQLRHTLPDGASHIDWLIARDGGAAPDDRRTLLSFRACRRIDDLNCGQSIELKRLEDHRTLYLRFQGELSGGRGGVAIEAAGVVTHLAALPPEPWTWVFVIEWRHPDGQTPLVVQELHLMQSGTGATQGNSWLATCARIRERSGAQ